MAGLKLDQIREDGTRGTDLVTDVGHISVGSHDALNMLNGESYIDPLALVTSENNHRQQWVSSPGAVPHTRVWPLSG